MSPRQPDAMTPISGSSSSARRRSAPSTHLAVDLRGAASRRAPPGPPAPSPPDGLGQRRADAARSPRPRPTLGAATSSVAHAAPRRAARASRRSAAGTSRPASARGRRARRPRTGARRVAPPPRAMRADLAVDAAQHRERVGALEARVVGDLVVGQERRVDDRAARRTTSPITASTWRSRWTTVAQARTSAYLQPRWIARLHVAPALDRRRAQLAGDVDDRQQQRARRVERAGEVREVVVAERSRARTSSTVLIVSSECAASPERMFAAARAVGVQQPAAVGDRGARARPRRAGGW